jgi:hypothetical protein
MLSLYLAFLYADKPYYNNFTDRILCMSKFLFDVQQKNRLQQKGLLRRFSIICYGHQNSIEELKSEKAAKYKELKKSGNTKEFEEWFLNYKPDDLKNKRNISKEGKIKQEKNTKKERKTKTKKERKTKTKKERKTKKSLFFNLYGNKTKKNKKELY